MIYAGVIATVAFAGIEAAANLAPDLEFAPVDLRKLVVARGDAGAADLRRRLGRRADGGAGGADRRRARRPRSAATYIEDPVLGVVQSFEPGLGRRTLMQVAVVADRAGGADLGGEHGDARPLAPRLRARHQPPDPELARQAQPRATRRRTWRSSIAAVIAFGLVAPDRRRAARRPVRVRGDDRVHDRPRLDHPAADHRARPPSGRSGSRSTSPFAARRVPLPTLVAARADRARLGQRDRLPRRRALGRRRLDAVRARRLRDLPQGRRGDDADASGSRCPAEALVKDVADARVRRHPRAGVRDQARRRHRRHRRPARRRRRPAGRDGAAARGDLRDRAAADGAARLAAAARPRRGARTRRSSARKEVGEEYETVEVHPSVVRARSGRRRDRRRRRATATSR